MSLGGGASIVMRWTGIEAPERVMGSVSVQFDKADRYHCNWIDKIVERGGSGTRDMIKTEKR